MRQLTAILLVALVLLSACKPYTGYFPSVDDPTDEDLNLRLSPTDVDYIKGSVQSVALTNSENECADWWYYSTDGRCLCSIHQGPGHIYSRTHYTYDTLRRRIKKECYVVRTENPSVTDTFVTTYTYSSNGRRCKGATSSTDANCKNKTFRFRLNRRGQVTDYIYPDGSRITYRYNKQGQLRKTIWLDGREEKYEPDTNFTEGHYDLDSLGNWVRQYDYEHGIETKREIKYQVECRG